VASQPEARTLLTGAPSESKRQRLAPGHYMLSPESDYGDSDGGGGGAAAAAAADNGDDDGDDDEYYWDDDDASDTEHFPSRLSGLGCG
jgi:hypothetical protein